MLHFLERHADVAAEQLLREPLRPRYDPTMVVGRMVSTIFVAIRSLYSLQGRTATGRVASRPFRGFRRQPEVASVCARGEINIRKILVVRAHVREPPQGWLPVASR